MRRTNYLKMWEDRGLALVWIDLDILKNKKIEKITGYGRNKMIYLFDKGFVKCFTSEKDWHQEKIAGEKFFSNYRLAKKTLKETQTAMRGVLAYYRKLWNSDFKKMDYPKLVNYFNKLSKHYSDFLVYFELTQPQRTEIIEKKLQQKYGNLYIELKNNIFTQENEDWRKLVKIARQKGLTAKETTKEIKQYSDKYLFLSAFETFQVLDEKTVFKRLKEEISHKSLKKDLIRKSRVKPIKNKLINILSDYAVLRANLSQYWTTPIVLGKLKFFKEFGRRLNINPEKLELILRIELDDVLRLRLKKIAFKERNDKFVLVSNDYKYKFYYGKEYQKISQWLEEQEKELKTGSIANQGVAKGTVKVISSEFALKKQFGKFKKGDILVTQMTTPNYLSILRKTAAIITDEGGICSHAAIVSRELNIPCIVGTKNATKVLKDGNRVEVDANKGVVKILK